jgi:hypothetical protein
MLKSPDFKKPTAGFLLTVLFRFIVVLFWSWVATHIRDRVRLLFFSHHRTIGGAS